MNPKIIMKKELFCERCKKSSKEEELLYCPVHKKAFCRECLIGRLANKFSDVAHCHKKYYIGDFYNKRHFNEIQEDCTYIKLPLFKEVKGNE